MKRWLWLRLTPMGRFERASAKRYAKMLGLHLPREVRAEQARRGLRNDAD